MAQATIGWLGFVAAFAVAALLCIARQRRAELAGAPWVAPWASGSWCASTGGGAPEPGLTVAELVALRPAIRRWVARRGVPKADVEDVVQAVMEAAWKSRRHWTRGSGALSSWIYIVTRNHVGAHLHRAHVRREEPVADPIGDWFDPEETPEKAAELREQAALAAEILDRLPAPLAALFERYEIDDDGMPEIAAELGIPLSTAWGQLGQARRAIALEVARARRRR